MAAQQGDVLLYQTNDNGDMTVSGGLVQFSSGLETSAYLSLFGGNEEDDGREGNAQSWWGNVDEEEAAQYRSRFQHLLRSMPAVPANLRRLEDAAKTDLGWMLSERLASEVEVSASMPALNTVRVVVDITAKGQQSSFKFTENWKASL